MYHIQWILSKGHLFFRAEQNVFIMFVPAFELCFVDVSALTIPNK